MNLSIRWKVALSALVAATLGLAVAGWLALDSIERLELARLEEALATRTGLALLSLHPYLQAGAPAPGGPLQARAMELSRRALARVTVITRSGLVLADSDTQEADLARLDNHATRPEVAQALVGQRGTHVRLSQTTGKRMLYFATPMRGNDDSVIAVIRLALPLTVVEARIDDLKRALGIAFGVALAVSTALSVLLARGLTRPFSEMADVARQVAAGALGRRIITPSRDEIGVLGATFNQMADRLETMLREVSEDRGQLLAVLTSMVEGVIVLDCRGKILQVNPALERMLVIQSPDVRGRLYGEVIRHHEFNELVTRVLETRQHYAGEITLAPSGRTFHVEASVAGSRRENEPCAIFVFHDVTALRRLEKVRKDFVANVSHELRTPLTSIKGYVEALLDGAKDDPEAAPRFLRIVLSQADRLNLILDDLLQLSQIESGEALFKREPVRLDAIMDRSLALIKPLADKKGHRITVDMPADLPSIYGDEQRLVQVMTNLLDNAVKYTPEQGTIHVAARPTMSGPADLPGPDQPLHQVVEVRVSDTGLGIPETDRPRVFERFYRVDKARSRELGGTGLGLAIVKHIIEGHDGRIWVEGHEPRGSRFVFQLPTAGASRPAAG